MLCGSGDGGLLHLLVEQTNLYAAQYLESHPLDDLPPHSRVRDWKDVTEDEMRAFLGLLLAMGIVQKPTVASYWNDATQTWLSHTPTFCEVMTRNRFQVGFSDAVSTNHEQTYFLVMDIIILMCTLSIIILDRL